MGHSLGLKVGAEGIETAAQLPRAFGYDIVQQFAMMAA
jgi:EAL domain-containing protein (putative c-di-GMP-specific phosphodiesterase class I)